MRENNHRRPERVDNRNSRPIQRNVTSRSSHNLLPSSRVLETYEQIAPGSVNKLIEMTKKEQEHRHTWQDKYLKFHNFSYKLGLIFGFIYNIALLYLITNLIKEGNQSLALKLFAINACLIAFAIIITGIERRITTRKPPRRVSNNHNKDRQTTPKTSPKTA